MSDDRRLMVTFLPDGAISFVMKDPHNHDNDGEIYSFVLDEAHFESVVKAWQERKARR